MISYLDVSTQYNMFDVENKMVNKVVNADSDIYIMDNVYMVMNDFADMLEVSELCEKAVFLNEYIKKAFKNGISVDNFDIVDLLRRGAVEYFYTVLLNSWNVIIYNYLAQCVNSGKIDVDGVDGDIVKEWIEDLSKEKDYKAKLEFYSDILDSRCREYNDEFGC